MGTKIKLRRQSRDIQQIRWGNKRGRRALCYVRIWRENKKFPLGKKKNKQVSPTVYECFSFSQPIVFYVPPELIVLYANEYDEQKQAKTRKPENP